MKKSERKIIIPDIKEFTDESGKKWVQTSTDDLFSMRELNEIIRDIEKERDKDEIILARIDFQKVDKEFYDAAILLQKRLQKQSLLLKKYVSESKAIIEKKNKKLKELIEYIKKLHQFIAYISHNPEKAESISLPVIETSFENTKPSIYEEVEEVVMKEDEE